MFGPFVRVAAGLALAATASLALAGCGSSTSGRGAGTVSVTAAFYPLAYAAERVGGDHVVVTSLTKPGAEPHDLELTPRQVAQMTDATLIVYEKGFQPAVDDAVATVGGSAGFDVSSAARLTLPAPHESGQAQTLSVDPHFWLDPTRYADVVTAIGTQLAAKDPGHAADYRANAAAMVTELEALDQAFRSGLARCAEQTIVTGHAAFGYLAQRYGLTQVSVSGISPDIEPTASQMSDIVALVRREGVSTVYAETLVSPALVETIARETGATVAVLDPVAGITKESAGRDYFAVMRADLATLEKGQQCS